MLNINDLSAATSLDAGDLREVRGGMTLPNLPGSFFDVTNAPIIDAGKHFLAQGQALGVDQSYNLGGLNLVIADQNQNGVSGQVVA